MSDTLNKMTFEVKHLRSFLRKIKVTPHAWLFTKFYILHSLIFDAQSEQKVSDKKFYILKIRKYYFYYYMPFSFVIQLYYRQKISTLLMLVDFRERGKFLKLRSVNRKCFKCQNKFLKWASKVTSLHKRMLKIFM